MLVVKSMIVLLDVLKCTIIVQDKESAVAVLHAEAHCAKHIIVGLISRIHLQIDVLHRQVTYF